jgi:RNA polymerase sigma-70 factor (ECF subfamily)
VPREVDADDVVQDVFLRIQEKLPSLREEERIDAWIFQIARNVVADAFRSRARRQALGERTSVLAEVTTTEEPERSAEAALVGCLATMIGELPEPYRVAIELTEIRGMTQIEAAREVGISLSGMKSRVQRGRERLASIIHDCCRIETDVRGAVTECDPLRPLVCSHDSMNMTNTPEVREPVISTTEKSGCCGGAAAENSDACCALDADVKALGGSGCGCTPKPATPSKTATPGKQGCC